MKIIDLNDNRIRKIYDIGLYTCRSDHFIVNSTNIFVNPNFNKIKEIYETGRREELFDHYIPYPCNNYEMFLYKHSDMNELFTNTASLKWYIQFIYDINKEKIKVRIPKNHIDMRLLLDIMEVDEYCDVRLFDIDAQFSYKINEKSNLIFHWDNDNYRLQYFINNHGED